MTILSRLHIPWEEINSSLHSNIPEWPLSSHLNAYNTPYAIAAILALAVIVSLHSHWSSSNGYKRIPVINPKGFFELTTARARRDFDVNSWEILRQGSKEYPDQAFRILSGELQNATVLPSRYANELKSDERFSFTAFVKHSFHGQLPGFRTFATFHQSNRIMQLMAQQELTRSLPKLVQPLSREVDSVLRETVTHSTVWHDVVVMGFVLPLIGRLGTLTFMGADKCQDKEWNSICTNYAVDVYIAAKALSAWPKWLRPFANRYLLPQCRALRALEAKARAIIDAQLEERRRMKAEAEVKGDELEIHDALEWYQSQYTRLGGPFDPTATQLGLSFTAIHTTSDLLTQVVLDLAEHQDMFEPLRKEVADCLSRYGGLNKSTLQDLHLLDSVIKESQRLKPVQIGAMQREVLEDVTLSGGVQVKRGTNTIVLPRIRDSSLFENPDEYDGYRFYRLRQQPGKEITAQLVTPTPEHTAFGYGKHACPGRFFASYEVKIALCHLLLKYEWKIAEGAHKPQWTAHGNNLHCDSLAKIAIRRLDAGDIETLL